MHCPSCNLKLGSGVAPIADYLERGVNVALGADGAAPTTAWTAGKSSAWPRCSANSAAGRAPGVAAIDLFEPATIGGARALGLDADIGSIEPGKSADLAVLDRGARMPRDRRTSIPS